MQVTAAEIAQMLEGQLYGNGEVVIKGVAPVQEAREGDIAFVIQRKYQRFLRSTKASAVIVSQQTQAVAPACIVVSNPSSAFLKVLRLFQSQKLQSPQGVHPSALIGKETKLGKGVSIGPHTVVGNRVQIGDGVIMGANIVVGDGCRIGEKSFIHPNVTLREGTEIGRNVVICSGAVIGSDGFGFIEEDGKLRRIPQLGKVIVEDDVEIGANATIDRATMGATRIGKGTKIDNLVQVAHNVTVGENTAIAAQVGISGSTIIGNNVKIGGQAGFVDHIQVGDRTSVGAQAGVTKSIPPGASVSGYPARSHMTTKRVEAAQSKLPALLKTIREQERRISQLEERLTNQQVGPKSQKEKNEPQRHGATEKT
jgi:UDP-3-O-[3-hydroxymyristoyl] glucosamine N-acyltransferase